MLLRLMLVASGQAPSTFLEFAVFPLSRQKFSNLYEAERALALFLCMGGKIWGYRKAKAPVQLRTNWKKCAEIKETR